MKHMLFSLCVAALLCAATAAHTSAQAACALAPLAADRMGLAASPLALLPPPLHNRLANLCPTLPAMPRTAKAASSHAHGGPNTGKFQTIDVPGASRTWYIAIGNTGAIAGSYLDAAEQEHSFLRTPGGTYVTFDPPGTVCGAPYGFCSAAYGIAPNGTIAGHYRDASGDSRGFLRAPGGTFTSFSIQGGKSVTVSAINPAGTVTGNYIDVSDGARRGFVRSRNGTIATFAAPGSTSTVPYAINPAGSIAGYYQNNDFQFHGFLRRPNGSITTIDPPGSLATMVIAINPAGVVGGLYGGATKTVGFLRSASGTVTSITGPDSRMTYVIAISAGGTAAGVFFDIGNHPHGFLRSTDGSFTILDPPNSVLTMVAGMNQTGAIVGAYVDAAGKWHGFLRRP